MIWKYLYQ